MSGLSAFSVAQCLAEAKALGLERIDVQRLLAHTLQRPRSWLLAHDDAVLSTAEFAQWRSGLARLSAGEPLAYVLGEQAFHGLLLKVDAAVLIPRSDTEVLVDWALQLLRGALSSIAAPNLVDLGTGSGAIALAIKHGYSAARVLATDNSPAALGVARANAVRLALDIETREGGWWQAVGDRRFHLAVSNPPYIAEGDPHLHALQHEPAGALSPGGTGLAALEAIVASAPAHMAPKGWLLLEHGHDQAEAVQALLAAQGFEGVETRRDLGGRARCTGAHR